MILEVIQVGNYEANCYVLSELAGQRAVIIDPGNDKEKILGVLAKNNLKPGIVVNTHGHFDHIGCDADFGVPVYIHRLDVALLADANRNFSSLFAQRPFSIKADIKAVEEGDVIGIDGVLVEVIHTPGHSPGGICLLMKTPENNKIFTGDTLFYQGIGRTDFPEGDQKLLIDNIKNKLFKLRQDIIIYPGHGPSSTIAGEKRNNPFLN